MDLCKSAMGCVAFTWVRPGLQGPDGVCWLKSTAGGKVRNACCVSGIVSIGKEGIGSIAPGPVEEPPGPDSVSP